MYVWGIGELGCWNQGKWPLGEFLDFSLMSLESLSPGHTGTVDHPGGNRSLDQSPVASHGNHQGSSK